MRGAVDRAHAAPADFAFNAESPGDDLGGVHLLTLSFGKEGRCSAAHAVLALKRGKPGEESRRDQAARVKLRRGCRFGFLGEKPFLRVRPSDATGQARV